MSLIKRAVSNIATEVRGANPYLEWGNTAPPPPGSIGGDVGGLHVTGETSAQVAAVYGCVSLLADSVASLPLRVLDKPATINTAKEIKTPLFLERPYELISLTDWIVQFMWALALRGNFYGQIIERDNLGHPTQIMPVSPDIVTVHVRLNGELEWRFAGKRIPTEDVFHVKYQSMPGHPTGLNPIEVMKYSFGLAHVLDVHAETTFRNSANPEGVLQAKHKLTPDKAKELALSWKAAHQGPHKSSLPAVLDEETEWKPITINPQDQQLLESRKFSQEEISGIVFRVPPFMLGLTERSTSFGRGIEQQERNFVTNTLQGYLTRIERSLTECLPEGQYANFDLRHRLRGDSVQRAEVAYKMILAGAWCGDDARATFDMPPAPEGQGKIFHSPSNTELLEMQEEELKQLKEKPAQPEPVQPEQFPENGKGAVASVPAPK